MPRTPPDLSKAAQVVIGDDVDLDTDDVRDRTGRRIDQGYVDDLIDTAHRRPGRPGLSDTVGRSPAVSFRLPTHIRDQAERVAAASGISVSQLARDALEERIAQAPTPN